MKPARFQYCDPETLDEALRLLAEHGDDAKILAGGQSLMPLLNMRLARPAVLVDLSRVPELAGIRQEGDVLIIGAMTRHREAETSPLVRKCCPLLAEALGHVGHLAIRTRGTIGGSLAHADPAAELPAVAAALEAELVIAGPEGRRAVKPEEFFLTYLMTSLAPGEILAEIHFPVMTARSGWAFREVSRRHGDFALVGVAAQVTLDAAGRVERAAVALTGVGPTPVRAAGAEALLIGREPDPAQLSAACTAVTKEVEPESDLHASGEYRRHLAGALTGEALALAIRRARGEVGV